MDINRLLPALILLLPLTVRAAEAFTEAELRSLYYADLGPATIDVAAYPKEQQENYQVFRRVCARCHTLARSVNSPRVSRKAWDFYIFEMRLRSILTRKDRYTIDEGKAILEFLVFDARKRKSRPEFEELSADLQNRFALSISERMRRLQEANPRSSP